MRNENTDTARLQDAIDQLEIVKSMSRMIIENLGNLHILSPKHQKITTFNMKYED